MNFDLTDDQLAFEETVRQFAQQELAPNAAMWDREHHFPVDAIKKQVNWVFVDCMHQKVPEALAYRGSTRLLSLSSFLWGAPRRQQC